MFVKISFILFLCLLAIVIDERCAAKDLESAKESDDVKLDAGNAGDRYVDGDDRDGSDASITGKPVKRIFAWQRRGAYTPGVRSWGRGFDRISYSSPLSRFHKRQPTSGFDKIGYSSPLSRFTKKNHRGFDRIGYSSALSNFNKRRNSGFDRISYASPLSGFAKRN